MERLPLRSAPPMQNEMQTRKSRGRLSRETLGKLGKMLEVYYDDVRKQGTPEKFRELLRQYEDRKDKGSS